MDLGKGIRQLRQAKHLTQKTLAERAGLTRAFVCWVEGGKVTPSVRSLERIAAALELPLYRFFYVRKKAPRMVLHRMAAEQAEEKIDPQYLEKLTRAIAKVPELDRAVLLDPARKLARPR
jgi:transcriptional regulator with XRE-family HTH domain